MTPFQLLIFAFVLVILGGIAGRLLGIRQPWHHTLFAAFVGLVIGGSFAAAIAAQTPGGIRSTDPLVIWGVALLVAMSVSVVLQLATQRDQSDRARSQRPGIPRPLRMARRLAARMQRYVQITWIVAKHGLSPYLRRWGADRSSGGRGNRSRIARSLRGALEEAGGVFVKLGQVLSTRPDLLPPDVIAELTGLQDQVPPDPYPAIAALLREEYGAAPDDMFASFDEKPLAAASIAQVYRAQLMSGEQVVVKVQRPGIRALVERDLDILLLLARTAEKRAAWAREFRVVELAERFAEVQREELDFRIEARNTTAVRKALGANGTVRVPAVYPQLSTSRALVIEWLDGVSVRDAGPLLDQLGKNRLALARALLQSMTRQILREGTFHADPHPGNVLALRDGQLALIDFGLVGRLDALQQAALRGMLVALERRHATMLRDALLDIAEARENADEDRLERTLAQFMAQRLGPEMTPDAAMFVDLFQILMDFGLSFPGEIGGVFRAMVTLEGTLNLLAPNFQIIDEVHTLAADWLGESLTPQAMRATVTDELLALAPLLRRLPRRLDRLAAATERGTLTVNVRLFADTRDQRFVSRLVSQALLAFLGAAIGVMAVVLLSTTNGPALTRSLSVLHAFGYFGLVISVMLILRVVVKIARE
jgi:ubiquinone biosynthesis protein